MDVIVMGPPGVGKGTQAVGLAERLRLVHVASGDLFRSNIGRKTELGLLAKAYVDRGELVPDGLVTDMVLERILASDVPAALLDGYPRTLAQARELPGRLAAAGRRIDAVVLLTAPDELLLRRIVGRQACAVCGEASNEYFQPTRNEGVCDVCGAPVQTRTDDSLETAQHRLSVYEEQTRPLADFYAAQGVLVTVDGTGDPDAVADRIEAALRTVTATREAWTDETVRTVATDDDHNVVIRLMRETDRDALLDFGAALPQDDWLYLDIDLQRPATVTRLVKAVKARNWRQLIAVDGERIVGYANVRQLSGWKKHVGDIALVVGADHRRLGLGAALASAVLDVAVDLSLTKLAVEIVSDRVGGVLIFKRFGFVQEGLLEDHAVDYVGKHHSLALLSYRMPLEASS